MDDEEEGGVDPIGRMPVGHSNFYGQMPKPDLDNAANASLVRFLVPFAIVFAIAAVIFLVLPGLWR